MNYGISKTVDSKYEIVLSKVTEELKKEGFGVITSIDVKDTIKKKLNLDFVKYSILGACNPPFAYEILESNKELGLFLPCNVIVYEDGQKTVVSAFNPMIVTELINEPTITAVANEVKTRLERVIDAI